MAWDEKDKKACCAIVKHCLAMANTDGGHLVIGVTETSSGPILDGLTEKQANSWETTRLNNFLNNYSDPPINTTMQHRVVEEERVVIIVVPRFNKVPHVCKKGFPKVLSSPTFYIRSDANASVPLGTSADSHALIENAVRRRSDQLLQSIRHILQSGLADPAPAEGEPYRPQVDECKQRLAQLMRNEHTSFDDRPIMHVTIFPSDFELSRLPIRDVKTVAKQGEVNLWGWPFLFVDNFPNQKNVTSTLNDCVETYYRHSHDRELLDYWRLYQSGLLFHSRRLHVTSGQPTYASSLVSMFSIAGTVLVACMCLVRLMDQYLNDSSMVRLDIEIADAQGVGLWQDLLTLPVPGSFVSQEAHILDGQRATLTEWRSGYADFASEIARDLFARFQFDHLGSGQIKSGMERKLDTTLA